MTPLFLRDAIIQNRQSPERGCLLETAACIRLRTESCCVTMRASLEAQPAPAVGVSTRTDRLGRKGMQSHGGIRVKGRATTPPARRE